MRIVSKRTHDYCPQCGWVTKQGGVHHPHCVLQYSSPLSEAVAALVFAKDMLESNHAMGSHTASTLREVLSKYPKLFPHESVLQE